MEGLFPGYPTASALLTGAFLIRPDLMQLAQTLTRRLLPSSNWIFTGCRFGSHRRRVLL
jgi:hypothetical protein